MSPHHQAERPTPPSAAEREDALTRALAARELAEQAVRDAALARWRGLDGR